MFSMYYFFVMPLRPHESEAWINLDECGLILGIKSLNKSKNIVLGDLLWDGGRAEGSPLHCVFFLLVFVFFWQIADTLIDS